MLLVPVTNGDGQPSSDIAAMGYDPVGSEMQIQFTTGRVYSYQPFPQSMYEAMFGAPSKGRFFAQFIKKSYPATRIDTNLQPQDLTTTGLQLGAGEAGSVLGTIERFEGLL